MAGVAITRIPIVGRIVSSGLDVRGSWSLPRRLALVTATLSALGLVTTGAEAKSGLQVPLRALSSGRTTLGQMSGFGGRLSGIASRPSDGTSLVVWSQRTQYQGFLAVIMAERFDAGGTPIGTPFRLDAPQAPPPSGYPYSGPYGPTVAYSPSTDSWIVAFIETYKGNCKTCSTSSLVDVQVDSSGRALSGPTVVNEGLPAGYGSFPTVACRTNGCLIIWRPGNTGRPMAMPLSSSGAPLSLSPSQITAGCAEDEPVEPDVQLVPTRSGFLAAWLTCTGLLLQPMDSTGASAGQAIRLARAPTERPGFPLPMTDDQLCAYNGGQRVLVTWLTGANYAGMSALSAKLTGVRRQIVSGTGRRIGKDTRSQVSISGATYVSAARGTRFTVGDAWLSGDPYANRCVLMTDAETLPPSGFGEYHFKGVDAYAYNSHGQIVQRSHVLRFNPGGSTIGASVQSHVAVWWKNSGLLLQVSGGTKTNTAFAYPLR